MRAVAGETAFEENEILHLERLGREARLVFEEMLNLAGPAALPACERDVRMERTTLRLETNLLTGAFDLRGQGGKRRLRLDASPQRAGAALFEPADAPDPGVEALGTDVCQSSRKVFCNRSLDLPNEAQGQVQLLLVLPAKVRAVVHCVDQQVPDRLGRANGDEQPVHRRKDVTWA